MEFKEEKTLGIDDTDENFTNIGLVESSRTEETKYHDDESILLKEIRRNIWGCDLVLCLFFGALNSYRQDRCLRPFPSFYITNDEEKDFNALKYTCDSIPSLENIVNESKKCSRDVIKLLHWLLIEKGYPVLNKINFSSVPFPSKFDNIPIPHHVFEVNYPEKVEDLWQKRKKGREIILAYHGSSIDNFYSILKVGLQQHFSFGKEVLFGNGIYLSNEISVSAHYSQFGQTWSKSSLIGKKLSIIAICEVINDTEKVKCRDSNNKQRSQNQGGMGEIPDKYFVVTDNEMVRLKYLLIYGSKDSILSKSFVTKNFFFIILGLYVLLIVLIGMSNNQSLIKIFKSLNPLK